MTSNFLIQATKILHDKNFDNNELDLITNFLLATSDDTLSDFNSTCTIISYDNDLQLYLEIMDALIKIYENKEEYEVCELIVFKKNEAIKIQNSKTI